MGGKVGVVSDKCTRRGGLEGNGAHSSLEREGFVLRFDAVIVFKEGEVGSIAADAACTANKFRGRRSKRQITDSILINARA